MLTASDHAAPTAAVQVIGGLLAQKIAIGLARNSGRVVNGVEWLARSDKRVAQSGRGDSAG